MAGFAVGLCALWLPDVLGVGKEALRFATIDGAFGTSELALLVVVKMLLTALCIGFGFAGGIFSPSLLIGILFGAFFWSVLAHATGIPHSEVAVYAICGMMALTSPIIGAPLSMIIIVFELTRNYDLTIAAMVSVVFGNLIAYRYFGRSLFDVQLFNRGVDLSSGRDQVLLNSVKLMNYRNEEYPSCRGNTSRQEVIQLLKEWGRAEALLIDKEGRYLGHVRLQDVLKYDDSHTARMMRIDGGLSFDEDTTLWEAMQSLDDFVGDMVPIVDKDTGKLIGSASEASIINAYLSIVHKLRKEENESA